MFNSMLNEYYDYRQTEDKQRGNIIICKCFLSCSFAWGNKWSNPRQYLSKVKQNLEEHPLQQHDHVDNEIKAKWFPERKPKGRHLEVVSGCMYSGGKVNWSETVSQH